jgi:hypothetical protein
MDPAALLAAKKPPQLRSSCRDEADPRFDCRRLALAGYVAGILGIV